MADLHDRKLLLLFHMPVDSALRHCQSRSERSDTKQIRIENANRAKRAGPSLIPARRVIPMDNYERLRREILHKNPIRRAAV